jgi:hypothetical protein
LPGPQPGRDDRRLQALSVFFIIVGLLLGPGYYAFCRYFSGQDSATIELKERSDRFVLLDGSIQRFRSGLGFRPAPLELHPERNEIRLSLRFQLPAGAAPADATNRYLLTVLDGDYPIVQRELSVPAKPDSNPTVVLPAFATRSPLDHLLILEELGKPGLPGDRVIVTVRENVAPLIATYLWSGVTMLLVGGVLYLVALRRFS